VVGGNFILSDAATEDYQTIAISVTFAPIKSRQSSLPPIQWGMRVK
jgi:hypothetical protein